MTPDTLFTWDALATLAGASFLTYLITAYTKRLVDRFWYWGTDVYAVLVGTLVLVLAQVALGASPTDWRIYVLSLFNGFLVAATAGKLHDKAVTERDRQRGEGA